jgi:uncharacterized phage protein (TIGR02218 family)
MAGREELLAHLAGGVATLCRAWAVQRRDGVVLGFTDHDRDLRFDGLTYRAETGMTARALMQTTGFAVDNSDAVGALSSDAVTEADLLAGRYDAAEVRCWLVNWTDVGQRLLQFRGTFGEIVRSAGAFRAELRGLTEALNQPQGRVYQRDCAAILGDAQCRFDLGQPGFSAELAVQTHTERRVFVFAGVAGFAAGWFEKGRLRLLDGQAGGVIGLIKTDRTEGGQRVIELWDRIGPPVAVGDRIRLEAGCDRQAATCQSKFNNFLNFRGFPHIPGEDWLLSYPTESGANDGGRLR